MKEVSKTVYESDDGKIFATEAECVVYERKQHERAQRTTYWVINHGPDLNEGRGNYGLTMVECYGPSTYDAFMYMGDWCFRTYGRPLAWVQGVAVTPNWSLALSKVEHFRNKTLKARVGDYDHAAKFVHLVVGPKDAGLVEAPAEKSA